MFVWRCSNSHSRKLAVANVGRPGWQAPVSDDDRKADNEATCLLLNIGIGTT